MSVIDWGIVVIYLAWMISDGLRRSKHTDEMEGYFLAGRSLPWWAVGLSVMATQLSAITLVGTTGQAYATGLRFVQFYFGLPLAMVLLSLTVVPSGWLTIMVFLQCASHGRRCLNRKRDSQEAGSAGAGRASTA